MPVVTGIAPDGGTAAGGTTVVVTGSGFTGATDVGFGRVYAPAMTVDSDTQITATSPAGTGTVDITVTTPAGTSATSTADQFTYAPAVTGAGPDWRQFRGRDIGDPHRRRLHRRHQRQLRDRQRGGHERRLRHPDHRHQPGRHRHRRHHRHHPAGTSATSPAGQFTYTPAALSVTRILPGSGSAPGGTVVTIIGAGFTGATGVSFGTASAPAMTVDSDAQITATSPAGTGTVDITVTTPAGTSATSTADQFTYTPGVAGPPQITSVRPNSGDALGGTLVTVSGSGLSPVTSVLFGAQQATTLTVVADSELTVLSPPGTGIVDVKVVSADGTGTAAAAFAYDAAVTVSVVRPDDLLLLQFGFANGVVETGPPAQVVPADPTQPMLVVVGFPPLHIGEGDAPAPAPGTPIPPIGPPIAAAMSGTSRLVFTVPPGVPLRLDALLDWSSWEPRPPVTAQAEPQPLESALELPYRVIVSTDGTARWLHGVPAAVLGGIIRAVDDDPRRHGRSPDAADPLVTRPRRHVSVASRGGLQAAAR